MSSNARQLAANLPREGGLSNRNVIINGNFDVWQRGTSQTTSGYGSADRWRVISDGTISASKVEDTVNGKKVATLSSTASGQTYHVIQQRLEHLRRYQGQTMTLSGWVKGSVGTFGQYIEFRDSGGNGVSSVTFNLTFTGSWQYVTYTFTIPTNAVFDNDSSWFNVSFYGGASLALSQIQLEVGDTATPFEHRSYSDTLQACKRYYQKVAYGPGSIVAMGQSYTSGTYGVARINYLGGEMRGVPTITLPPAGQGSNLLTFLKDTTSYPTTTGTHSAINPDTFGFRLHGSGYSGLSSGASVSWVYTGSGSGNGVTFEYDAEL